MLKKTTSEWTGIFSHAGIPASPINSIGDIVRHEQVKHRKMIVEADDREIGKVRMSGNPIKLNAFGDSDKREPAPNLGEHTNEILAEFGYSEERITELKDKKIVQ